MSNPRFHQRAGAPAQCTVDVQGTCIPNAVQYMPQGPPCSQVNCGCGNMNCLSNRFNDQGLCPGYKCGNLGGLPLKMDTLDYYGQVNVPWLTCGPNMKVDPVTNYCVHDFSKGPFRTWSWQASLKDFVPF